MISATKWTVIGLTLAIIVFDIIAFFVGGVESTISRITLRWAQQNPALPFAGGVLCGHLFWPQKPEPEIKK